MTLQSNGRRVRGDDPVARRIRALAPWFHNLHLPGGRQTAPDHPLGDFPAFKWRDVSGSLPADLRGWTALDVGCNAGFYSIELGQRGAQVLGIDSDEHYLRQARWAATLFGVGDAVRFERRSVYELAHDDVRFDLVLFMGVLYHLRHPLLALDLLAEKAEHLLVVQTLTMPGSAAVEPPADLAIDQRDALQQPGWPAMAFVERRLAGDPTNWWAPNAACVEAMLRTAGLRILSRPGEETWVCEPAESPLEVRALVRGELDAATGRSRGRLRSGTTLSA